jgi:hypothetical protein
MKLEIKAMVQGKPAYAAVELPDVTWIVDDGIDQPPVNTLPNSIRRIDLVDGDRRVTRR